MLPSKPTLSLGTSWPTPKVMSPNVTKVSIVYFSTFLCIPGWLVARFWAMRWTWTFVESGGGRCGALWNCWLCWYRSQEREMWLVSSLPYLRHLDFLPNMAVITGTVTASLASWGQGQAHWEKHLFLRWVPGKRQASRNITEHVKWQTLETHVRQVPGMPQRARGRASLALTSWKLQGSHWASRRGIPMLMGQ